MRKPRSRAQRSTDKLRKRQSRALVNASFIYHPVNAAWRVNAQRLLNPGPSQHRKVNTNRQLKVPESVGIHNIRGDGNCFFNSLSHVIFGDQSYNALIRERICDHLVQNIDELRGYLPEPYRNNVGQYLQTSGMRCNGTWATEVEIFTASHLLQTDIYLYSLSGQRWVWLRHRTVNRVGEKGIYLYHANQNHFDVVVGNSDTQDLDTVTLTLQEYFVGKLKQQHVDPKNVCCSNKSPLPQKSRESERYYSDKEFKEKKKQQSKEWANNKYQTDVSYQQNKKIQQNNRYDTDLNYKENTKMRSKNKSKNLYKTDLKYKEHKKTRSKTRSNTLYETDLNYKDHKKTRSKTRSKTLYETDLNYKDHKKTRSKTRSKTLYESDVNFRENKKAKLRLKYRTDKIYRYNKKLCDRIWYSKVSAYRISKMLKSVKKYASNVEFKDRVKSYSSNKYARFDSFRRNLKISSIKKYSSKPLFRTKLKECLRQQYHTDYEVRLKKKKSVTVRRKCIATAVRTFQKSISDVPVYTCTVCIRVLYKSQVKTCNRSKYMKKGKLTEIAEKCLTGKYVHSCTKECTAKCPCAQEWICFTCHRHLLAMNMPPQALANGLDLADIPPELKRLNSLEKQLVALRLPFMKIVSLPKGGQKGVKGPVINVPSDVDKVATTLPRTPNESQLIRVKLKRKLSYKGHLEYEWINPQNVREAVEFLKQYNKWYADVHVTDNWFDEVLDRDLVRGADEVLNSTAENNHFTLNDADREATIITDEMTDDILPSQMSVDEVISDDEMSDQISDREIKNQMSEENVNDKISDDEMKSQRSANEVNDHMSDDDIEQLSEVQSYPVETCLQPLDIAQEILDTDGKIFCLAPGENQSPKSVFKEPQIEAMAFPHLLPDGDFGFSMHRSIKLTPSKYFNARLLCTDTRFAAENQYIFFAQYVCEITNVTSKISIALRKGKQTLDDGHKLKASMLRDPDNLKKFLSSDIGFRFLQPVRGSPPYWERTMRELYSMIRQIGIPTFFLTFSAAEMRWHEVIETLLLISHDPRKASELEWSDKCQLIKNNALMCARLFDHRVKALFRDILLSPAQPIGKVIDFFVRTEFQLRGSPHIHSLVWIKDAPQFDKDSDRDVCRFVDEHVSCQLPDKNTEPELFNIVQAVQMHNPNHTKSCRKHNTACRFNFPRPPIKNTFIIRPDDEVTEPNPATQKAPTTAEEFDEVCKTYRSPKELLKCIWNIISSADFSFDCPLKQVLQQANTTYKEYKDALKTVTRKNTIYHKRNPSDCWVNNYNKYLLTAWNANIDIQYVTDAYSCVAYILAYISKAESEMSELLQSAKKEAAEGCKDAADTMKQIGHVYMNNREISAQEAVYRVCSLKLKDCSREVTFIPTGSKTIKMSLPMNVIRSKNDDEENIWMTNIIERYYARPASSEFNNMCLADFCSLFTVIPKSRKPKSTGQLQVYELQNDLGFIRKRRTGKESVIRYPRFNVNKSPEEYYMTLVQLFLPHRDADMKQEFERYEAYVLTGVENGLKVLEIIEKNRDRYESNPLQLDKAWEDFEAGKVREDGWAQIAPEAESARLESLMEKEVPLYDEYEQMPELETIGDKETENFWGHHVEQVKSLMSEKQTMHLMRQLNIKQAELFYHIRNWCVDKVCNKNPEPFRIFLTGGAGTGKTHVIKCIFMESTRILSKMATNPETPTVMLVAPTGTAAYNIQGTTIHSALSIPKAVKLPYKPLGENLLNTLRSRFEHLQIVVIDEISMVDHKMLTYIHGRLAQIKKSKQPFGNISILSVGDFYQLPPIKATPLYRPPSVLSADLWNSFFEIATLDEIMRQKDADFANLLNRIRTHLKGIPLIDEDIRVLSSVSTTCTPDEAQDALHIFPTNAEVDKHNEKIVKLRCQVRYMCKAKDLCRNTVTGQLHQRGEPYSTKGSEDLPDVIEIGIRARVMLIRNVDVEDGLVNGAFGTIHGIQRSKEGEVSSILIKFDNDKTGKKQQHTYRNTKDLPAGCVKICPVEEPVKGRNVTRRQFPLRLGWAATIHKVQGMTVAEIVISLKKTFSPGMAYVALSRVTSLKGLHIIDFDPDVIYSSPDVAESINSMTKFVPYTNALTTPDACSLEIAFHNTEGLLPHLKDLKKTESILKSDIICLSETWLKKDAYLPPDLYSDFNPHCCARSEAYSSIDPLYAQLSSAERGGIATFVHKHLDSQKQNLAVNNLECIAVKIKGPTNLLIVNVYRPPVYPLKRFCENFNLLLLQIDERENGPILIVGDFNDDILRSSSMVMQLCTNYGYSQGVCGRTTESGSCLDLVFHKNFQNSPTCYVLPIYYSFHDIVKIFLH